ncbi:MAG: hypothetical protein WC793_02210 [Candidatus Paceibacterota bacterium]|jgi:hypothetical protein
MKNFFKNNNKKKSGYSVVELIFYIAIFSVVSIVVIDAMIVMARSLKETSLQNEFIQNGTIMERVSREIRASYAIGSIGPTDLVLNTKDNSGANKTVEFLLSGSNLQLLENGTLTGNLNAPSISISNLIFTQITTAKGKAVKVSFSIQSSNDLSGRIQNFYDTVVLRGYYR